MQRVASRSVRQGWRTFWVVVGALVVAAGIVLAVVGPREIRWTANDEHCTRQQQDARADGCVVDPMLWRYGGIAIAVGGSALVAVMLVARRDAGD